MHEKNKKFREKREAFLKKISTKQNFASFYQKM